MNRKKLLGMIIALLAMMFFFQQPASATADWNGNGGFAYGVPISHSEITDSDYTGTGTALPDPFFDGTKWDETKRTGCTQINTDPLYGTCAFVYPTYPINCLSSSTTLPAWRVLWVYSSARDESTLYHRSSSAHLADVRQNLRETASIFSASTDVQDIINTGGGGVTAASKAYDRSPRFTTGNVGGQCIPSITDVPVPATVLQRPWLQTHDAAGNYAPGLQAWLMDNGYAQANRNNLIINDQNNLTTSDCSTSSTQTWASGYANPGGAKSVATNPANDPSNWGGQSVNICVSNSQDSAPTMEGVFDPNVGSPLATLIAHEMGHASGTPINNPEMNVQSPYDGHLRKSWDIMSTLDVAAPMQWCIDDAQSLSDYDQKAMSAARFDCQHDDFWARNASWQFASWAPTAWSMSENAFLWGTPKPTTYKLWDIRQINPQG